MAYARPSLQELDVDANVGQHALFNGGSSDPKDGLHGRAYQYEMLEESMKRNIIIAAETGSGKTLMLVPLSRRPCSELSQCNSTNSGGARAMSSRKGAELSFLVLLDTEFLNTID